MDALANITPPSALWMFACAGMDASQQILVVCVEDHTHAEYSLNIKDADGIEISGFCDYYSNFFAHVSASFPTSQLDLPFLGQFVVTPEHPEPSDTHAVNLSNVTLQRYKTHAFLLRSRLDGRVWMPSGKDSLMSIDDDGGFQPHSIKTHRLYVGNMNRKLNSAEHLATRDLFDSGIRWDLLAAMKVPMPDLTCLSRILCMKDRVGDTDNENDIGDLCVPVNSDDAEDGDGIRDVLSIDGCRFVDHTRLNVASFRAPFDKSFIFICGRMLCEIGSGSAESGSNSRPLPTVFGGMDCTIQIYELMDSPHLVLMDTKPDGTQFLFLIDPLEPVRVGSKTVFTYAPLDKDSDIACSPFY